MFPHLIKRPSTDHTHRHSERSVESGKPAPFTFSDTFIPYYHSNNFPPDFVISTKRSARRNLGVSRTAVSLFQVCRSSPRRTFQTLSTTLSFQPLFYLITVAIGNAALVIIAHPL
jgi:hypothetical protein